MAGTTARLCNIRDSKRYGRLRAPIPCAPHTTRYVKWGETTIGFPQSLGPIRFHQHWQHGRQNILINASLGETMGNSLGSLMLRVAHSKRPRVSFSYQQ